MRRHVRCLDYNIISSACNSRDHVVVSLVVVVVSGVFRSFVRRLHLDRQPFLSLPSLPSLSFLRFFSSFLPLLPSGVWGGAPAENEFDAF